MNSRIIEMRDVRPEDKQKIRDWRNRPGVARYMLTDHEITPEEHDRWFARITSDPTVRYWIIVYEGQDVGLCNLDDIDQRHRRCNLGFYVAEEAGKGIGGFVENFVLRYVFQELKMNKLCGQALATNQRVLELHKFFGFKEEGYFRQHVIKSGKPVDVCCIALLKEEWEQRRR